LQFNVASYPVYEDNNCALDYTFEIYTILFGITNVADSLENI